jgi:hypothetical protein
MIVNNQQLHLLPCGMRGVGCSGQCAQCPSRPAPARGMGALTDFLPDISGLPAPLNSWPVLLAIIAAVVFFATGGTKMFRGSSSGKSRALRLARLKATEERAHILQQ